MPARHAGAKLNYDCMALINAGSTGRRRAVLAGRHCPARSARVVRLRHRAGLVVDQALNVSCCFVDLHSPVTTANRHN